MTKKPVYRKPESVIFEKRPDNEQVGLKPMTKYTKSEIYGLLIRERFVTKLQNSVHKDLKERYKIVKILMFLFIGVSIGLIIGLFA